MNKLHAHHAHRLAERLELEHFTWLRCWANMGFHGTTQLEGSTLTERWKHAGPTKTLRAKSGSHCAAAGNGNITAMSSTAQAISANYKYDAFGNLISSSGSMASANLYRFSSKELNLNAGIYYYGFRFYHPSLQRWLNQDPIGEAGGINLYQYVRNEPTLG